MIPLREDATAPIRDTIHRPRHARPDRLHSTTEGLTVRRLDDQVSMVALQ